MTPARFLSMHEAAERAGHVSVSTLYRLARAGHLPVRRIGRRLVISEARLDAWINGVGDVRSETYPREGTGA
jgi:excisionase family DNA binding protein